MANLTTIRTRISEIDTALASGAKTVALDGVNITLDLDSLRKERERLEKLLPESKYKRPLAFRANMG